MRVLGWKRVAVAGATLILGMALSSPAPAAEVALAPPENLQVTAVYSDSVRLAWEPGSDDPDQTYRVHNLTLGWDLDTTATTFNWRIGMTLGETYSFAVTQVGPDDTESAPSNQVTATPQLAPPAGVEATLDDDTITVQWNRPEGLDPGRPGSLSYYVYLNGELERYLRVSRSTDSIQISFPVVDPGITHEYTVRYGGLVSDPAALTVPAAADTTPPTVPTWIITCPPELTHGWEITGESTDDTTPSSEIRYEAREFSGAGSYVLFDDFPRSAAGGLEDFSGGRIALRAVDEAGNRSAPLAIPTWEC